MIGIVTLKEDSKTWAEPLVEEIQKFEPDYPVAVEVAYPGKGSYAASINNLARRWIEDYPEDPWFFPMNADVSMISPFDTETWNAPKDKLYGCTVNTRGDLMWLDGWIYMISRKVWETVGEFDENFKIACFEDADYTWRAVKAGIGIAKVTLPFLHHRASPRMRVPDFWKIRKENQAYLIEKWDLPEEWSYR